MGSGFSKMKKQARMMEAQMQAMQENLKQTECEGSSGNGLVRLVIDGEKNIKSLKIKPECVDKDDVEGLEDLILAAFKDALSKAEKLSQNLPSFPF
jgi:DNA-binding YbaB/EbfC family protein